MTITPTTTPTMTQGAFSYLPALTDDEVLAQVEYAIRSGWTVSIEHTAAPAPRNHYWQMWGLPQFDESDAGAVLADVIRCRAACPDDYIKVSALDPAVGRQVLALSFIVHRPADRA